MSGANTRPIVIRRVKKIAGGHHGGAWKVAYADFVTAMMAFFMLLWLISNPDKQRLKGLAEYFTPSAATSLSQITDAQSSASGVSGMPGAGGHGRRAQSEQTQTPRGQPSTKAGTAGTTTGGTAGIPDPSLRVMAQEMRVAIDALPPEDPGRRELRVEEDRDGLRISLTDTASRSMFKAGTAVLNPFAREMLARVRSVLRRRSRTPPVSADETPDVAPQAGAGIVTARFAGWSFDVRMRTLTSPAGVTVPVTNGEYGMLLTFVSQPRTVHSRERLAQASGKHSIGRRDRTIDVNVSRLRRKLADHTGDELIRTVRSGGYLFLPAVTCDPSPADRF